MNVIAHSRHSAALSKNSRLVFKIALGLLTLAVAGIVAANAIGVSAVSIRGMLFGASASDAVGARAAEQELPSNEDTQPKGSTRRTRLSAPVSQFSSVAKDACLA